MRIGVDSRPLREAQTSGIPNYVRSVLRELERIDTENEYVLYAHKDFDFPLPNERWRKHVGALTRYGTVWLHAELPLWLKKDRIDIFWGTQHSLPFFMPKSMKAILTVLDLVHLVFPETMRLKNRLINRVVIPPSVHRADALVSISKWTENDVRRYLNPQKKIMEVTYLGYGEQFFPRDPVSTRERVLKRFGLPSPYLLTVGTFEPRKNLRGVIRALVQIANEIPHHLAVVGQRGWKNESVQEELAMSSIAGRVHMLGYVDNESLPYLFAGADAFVFPSFYEGFGIPPLEAMASGVPVVASNVSSIPEVVGDAAEMVDPNMTDSIAQGILNVVLNPERKKDLVLRGLHQSTHFTWQTTARQMLHLFHQLRPT